MQKIEFNENEYYLDIVDARHCHGGKSANATMPF